MRLFNFNQSHWQLTSSHLCCSWPLPSQTHAGLTWVQVSIIGPQSGSGYQGLFPLMHMVWAKESLGSLSYFWPLFSENNEDIVGHGEEWLKTDNYESCRKMENINNFALKALLFVLATICLIYCCHFYSLMPTGLISHIFCKQIQLIIHDLYDWDSFTIIQLILALDDFL